MKEMIPLFILLLFNGSNLWSQTRPFPQNVDYPYGYKTSLISTEDIQQAYDTWKTRLLRECNGMYRVGTEDINRTISESIGYGMLLTAYHGEKEYFDGLFEFYKSKRTDYAYGLMAWEVTCDSITDQGSATDGDLDAAFSLIVAHNQWGENYLAEAKKILSILKEYYFVQCGRGYYTMKPGGQFGGCNLTDLSYYTPGYFRVFAEITGDDFWNTAAEHTYIILENRANDSTGLVSDWQAFDGADPPSGWTNYYRYDASRTPWRMSFDYLWNGNTTAQEWCTKVTNFAASIGPSRIVDGYNLDGTPRGQYNNSAFVGGFAVGSMCTSQEILDSFATRLLQLQNGGGDNQYFNLCLRNLYMLTLTGNFWKPGISDNYFDQPLPGNSAVIFAKDIISNSNIHGRLVISPDGKEILWNFVNFTTLSTKIYHVVYKEGNWSSPEVCSFAVNGLTANPVFSLDGNKLFFEFRTDINSEWKIEYVEKVNDTWSEPKADQSGLHSSSSFTKTGKVYYSDYMSGKAWNTGIYYAAYKDTGLTNIQPLNSDINSRYIDYTPYVSPDEDILLFCSSRPSMNENMYLYVCFKNTDGTWSSPQKINSTIGFSGNARFPSISPDGKYLFFCGDDGNVYWIRMEALSSLNPTVIKEEKAPLKSFNLYQNYPNPFNPSTTIKYQLSNSSIVKLKIYDSLGREIKTLIDSFQNAGEYSLTWDATDEHNNRVSSGIYLYKLETEKQNFYKKMILLH